MLSGHVFSSPVPFYEYICPHIVYILRLRLTPTNTHTQIDINAHILLLIKKYRQLSKASKWSINISYYFSGIDILLNIVYNVYSCR